MITLYLDSSDFSRMSQQGDSLGQKVLERLQSYISAGRVEVRFSAFHVIECAHIDSASKSMALGRMEMISRLSQGKCLKIWPELMFAEMVAIANGQVPSRETSKAEDGMWFPDLKRDEKELRASLATAVTDAVSSTGRPRHERRGLLRQLLKKDRLTSKAVDLLRPNRKELLEKLANQYPVSERFFEEDLFLKFATGEVSMEEIATELEKSFTDLEVFVGWIFDTYDPERKATQWLRRYGGDLIDRIDKVRATVESVIVSANKLGVDTKEINRLLKKAIDERDVRNRVLWHQFEEHAGALQSKGITKKLWDERVVNSEIGNIPSMDSLLLAMVEYFTQSSLYSKGPRRLKRSDAGDLFHMCYLPYVDIFRCDAFAGTIAKRVAGRFRTKVVDKLDDLVAAIETLQ